MTNTFSRMACTAGLVIAAVIGSAGIADAQWTDRVTLKFSEPVMVPGATLQPGSYVFSMVDPGGHIVEIRNEKTNDLITLANAVPMKRQEAKGDVVVKFNPTDTGSPVALKGWYAPGTVYGHQFVYKDAQAKEIANRTKTLVLSVDVPGTDLEKGTLRTYDASGRTSTYTPDAATMREWETWRQNRPAARASVAGAQEPRTATAPMVKGDFQGTRVKIGDLEEEPLKYAGKTVSVDAEVEEVFGPRLFTIDEPHWGDLDGEILVFMPTPLAALVKDDDRITITGTVKPFVRAEVEKEWGWLGLDPEVEVDFAKKPILVASRIVGGNNNVAMVIDLNAAPRPVGTTGTSGAAMTDVSALIDGDEALVGRDVSLKGLRVTGTAKEGGFYVESGNSRLFILPAEKDKVTVREGETVSVDGVVLQMPDDMDERAPKGTNVDIYVYAKNVSK